MVNWPRAIKALLNRLDTDQPLIIDPPAELLALLPPAAYCISLDYAVWRRLYPSDHSPPFFRRGVWGDASEASLSFNAPAAHIPPSPPSHTKGGIVLFMPRSRERLAWWLHRLSAGYPGQTLWIAGANSQGGRGLGKQIENTLQVPAQRTDNLGRAGIWRCELPQTPPPAPDPWRQWRHNDLTIHALPGVFGYQGVDPGSALLLETLPSLDLSGHLLDFGCGTGLLALAAAHINPQIRLTLADSDALALVSAAHTFESNNTKAEIGPADGWTGISGPFDWIVSNPPFHVGAKPDLSIVYQLIEKAPEHLVRGGRLALVANRHLPLEQALGRAFAKWEIVNENSRFKIIVSGPAE